MGDLMKPTAAPRSAWVTFAFMTVASLTLWGYYFTHPDLDIHTTLGVLGVASTLSVLAGLNLGVIVILRFVSRGQKAIFTEVYDDHRQIVAKIEGQEARVDDAYWSGYGDCSEDKKPTPPFPPYRQPKE